jgi:hypothetical protein
MIAEYSVLNMCRLDVGLQYASHELENGKYKRQCHICTYISKVV